jgi:transposase-like protein
MSASESCLAASRGTTLLTTVHKLLLKPGNLYCRLFHRSISRPAGGRYRCWSCHREFEIGW